MTGPAPALSGSGSDLTGRVALITGGAGGIGMATARLLGAAGAAVALVDVDGDAVAASVEELTAAGVGSVGWAGDVADPSVVEHAVERTEAELGVIDLVVNNAAVGIHTPPEDTSLADWQRVIDVDLTGYFLVATATARRMLATGTTGTVVNIASIAGSSALGRGNFAYSVAKGGVIQMTRELAVEWAPRGIRVNAIQPCQVNTPGWRRLVETDDDSGAAMRREMVRGIPIGRVAEPEDIAAAVQFLSSPAAAMVTGAILPVDGGNLALNAGGTVRG